MGPRNTDDIYLQLAIAESRKNKLEMSLEDIRTVLNLPENLTVGHAIDNGGCFFDSLAQSLNFIRNTDEYSEKSLRILCYEYYRNNKIKVDAWNKADNYKGNYNDVQFTEAELLVRNRDKPPIWGRPNVEGRILCEVLNIDKIFVIEIQRVPMEDVVGFDDLVPCYSISTKDGVFEQEELRYDENIPTVLSVAGELHFNPILPKRALNQKVITHHKENISNTVVTNAPDLTQRLEELNTEYLAEKAKDEYKPYEWLQKTFGWKNTFAWQSKAEDLRISARNELEYEVRRMNNTEKNNKLIDHAVTLGIFNEHRSNYLNTDGDTDTVAMIKAMKR